MRSPVVPKLLTVAVLCTYDAFASDTGYPLSADAVVTAFVAEDAQGSFLSGETAWRIFQYTTWFESPGWDVFIVIKRCTVGLLATHGVTAEVEVKYQVLGTAEMFFHHEPKIERAVYKLKYVRGRWKIESPMLNPHVRYTSAIAILQSSGYTTAATQLRDVLGREE